MPGTFEDQAQLAQLFQQSFSPVTNYSQGLLALAMKQRERANQLSDTANQQAFTLQRDQAQAELQTRLEKSAQDAATERLKAQWEHADQEEKDKMLEGLRAQAAQTGLPMPSSKLTKDEQADYFNGILGQSHADKALNLINSTRELEQQFTQLTGTYPKERSQHQIDVLLANPASLALTPQERIALKSDPASLPGIIARLQKDKSKKGKAAADDFVLASSAAGEATDLFYAKYSKNPEAVADIVAKKGLVRDALRPVLSDPNLPSGLFADMFSSIGSTAKQIQAEQQPDKFKLPPVTQTAPSPATATGSPSGLGPFQDFYYNVGAPAPGLLAPVSNVNAPPLNASSTRVAPSTPSPFIPPIGSVPGAQTDPSVLSTLRLQKFLRDSAAQSSSLFPTAYPSINPAFAPAATAP